MIDGHVFPFPLSPFLRLLSSKLHFSRYVFCHNPDDNSDPFQPELAEPDHLSSIQHVNSEVGIVKL
jgi:hypothetical protein